jgi:hypothetical protein
MKALVDPWPETDVAPQSPHVRYWGMNRLRSDAAQSLKMTQAV